MKKPNLLIMLFFLSIIYVQPNGALSVDVNDPVNATLGLNTGTLENQSSVYYYQFLAESNDYMFSLSGPTSTDFDMRIYDLDGILITSAIGVVYPDNAVILNYQGILNIEIYSFSGFGDFALNISIYEDPQTNNPVDAYLGMNIGTLDIDNPSHQFNFATTVGNYSFQLSGPDNTDFDLHILDEFGEILAGAYGIDYPDTAYVINSPTIMTIEVYSFFGYGEFSLNISSFIPTNDPQNPPTPDPIAAELGSNMGVLTMENPFVLYEFISVSGNYSFQLSGPEDSDFDMYIMNEFGEILASAFDVEYPDIANVINAPNLMIIEVYSYYGYGEFVLNISEYTPIPGESYDYPINAQLGDNFGSIGSTGVSFLRMDETGSFAFSLTGPEETDFDMIITTLDGEFIDGAFGVTYPDTVTIYNLETSIIITVYSFSGYGDYVLHIEQVADLEGLHYYNFVEGDIFEWEIETGFQSDGNTEGSSIRVLIEILETDPVWIPNAFNELFNISMEDEYFSDYFISDNAGIFILPIYASFSDGTMATTQDELPNMSNDARAEITWSCDEVTCTSTYSNNNEDHSIFISITYNIITGILVLFDLTI
ncbi:MAG: hypothetical protein OEZ01_05545, partial [Candidatus Heimdallarchaeota archaeon]|nr:hypothetical protein [Candidatus Heimdallarchaeota archaeon]